MSEWFKVPVLKTGMLFKVSGVRILPHPYELECYAVLAFSKLLLFATCLYHLLLRAKQLRGTLIVREATLPAVSTDRAKQGRVT